MDEFSQRAEGGYKGYFMTHFDSYGSEVVISRGCVKFNPVAFFKIQNGRQKTSQNHYYHHYIDFIIVRVTIFRFITIFATATLGGGSLINNLLMERKYLPQNVTFKMVISKRGNV